MSAELLSKTRVLFAWLLIALYIAIRNHKGFAIKKSDAWWFALLGLFGIAGANYFLYRAIGQMNAAVADLVQFTAPILVVAWMAITRKEPLDRPKLTGLLIAIIGCSLALGITRITLLPPLEGLIPATLSAVCFAITIILGKKVSGRYGSATALQYSLLFASLFWLIITPPSTLTKEVATWGRLGLLIVFAVTSILLPYLLFFAGLKRVPASRGSIVSTFEPVVVALGSWILLSEALQPIQILGVALVCTAIVLVEITSPQTKKSVAPATDGNG